MGKLEQRLGLPRRQLFSADGKALEATRAALDVEDKETLRSGLPSPGKGSPVVSVRMTEDELDMLDLFRGSMTRSEGLRVLVRSVDRITGA